MASVATKPVNNLKDHVYRVLRWHGIPVFMADIANSRSLYDCGIDLGCTGLKLLEILIYLVREGKLVACYEDNCSSLCFISMSEWQKELNKASKVWRQILENSREYFIDGSISAYAIEIGLISLGQYR